MTHENSPIKKVLTIATSDSGGGAGIQTDIKTITCLGSYATSVFVALTAQNTLGVQGIYELPLNFIEQQMDSVLTDIGTDAAKTGMLFSKEIVAFVTQKVVQYNIPNLVVDPVMVASSGDRLLKEDAVDAYRTQLLPKAFLVTPNLFEAEILSAKPIKTLQDTQEAAKIIFDMGVKNVLIKGGHLACQRGAAVDVLYDGRNFTEFTSAHINTKNTHGTGCTLSAALATFLAQGSNVYQAVEKAKAFITRAIEHGLTIGGGNGPTNPYMAGKE